MARTVTLLLILSVFTFLFTTTSAFASPVIVNGSFENPTVGPDEFHYPSVPGWTHTGAPGDGWLWHDGPVCCGGSDPVAPDGVQFATLGGGYGVSGSAAWYQDLTGFSAGQSYTVSFMLADEFTYVQPVTASIIGAATTVSQTFDTIGGGAAFWTAANWSTYHFTFVAPSTDARLEFSVDNQPYDIGLDAVTIAPVGAPEPSGLILLSSGLVGFAGLIRRKMLR